MPKFCGLCFYIDMQTSKKRTYANHKFQKKCSKNSNVFGVDNFGWNKYGNILTKNRLSSLTFY